MKTVLIVSDNVDLVSHFKIISKTISSSIVNKSPDELRGLDMSVVDMKNVDDIKSIISKYDLVISAHCKQIFPEKLVNGVRCINIHPGFNPYNRGWYPQVFSIVNKKPIGCTIHIMDAEIDHGDVIYQKEIKVNSWDTSLDVYKRVIDAEKQLINKHLLDLVSENYECKKLEDDGNYNGIKDFNKLTSLDLSSNGTLREHIDLLRALTHGNFGNAFFVDDGGNKVFVRLFLESDNS
jgi:methionyl-tRNA formyltransferase